MYKGSFYFACFEINKQTDVLLLFKNTQSRVANLSWQSMTDKLNRLIHRIIQRLGSPLETRLYAIKYLRESMYVITSWWIRFVLAVTLILVTDKLHILRQMVLLCWHQMATLWNPSCSVVSHLRTSSFLCQVRGYNPKCYRVGIKLFRYRTALPTRPRNFRPLIFSFPLLRMF